MRTFTMLVHDTRQTVPNLLFVMVDSEDRAKELAGRELNESEYYLAVDVLEHDRPCFRVKR